MFRRFLFNGWWYLVARWHFRGGRYERAEAQLRRMTSAKPASFSAHFLLGRVGLATGRHVLAIREFTVCHLLDSDRLARMALPASVVMGVLARPERRRRTRGGRSLDHASPSSLPDSWSGVFGPSPWDGGVDLDADTGSVNDFISAEECRRFEGLPPIRSEDLVAVDMDELLRQLAQGDDTTGDRDLTGDR